jgi:hypothetical protein
VVLWSVAAFSGKVLRYSDVAPPGVLGDAGRPRPLSPEEEARRDEQSAREFVAAFAAAYGGG